MAIITKTVKVYSVQCDKCGAVGVWTYTLNAAVVEAESAIGFCTEYSIQGGIVVVEFLCSDCAEKADKAKLIDSQEG